jgi:hypothetical protein
MKKIYYGILPAVAFLLILTNAFYGHILFVSASEHVVNKYEVYVHLQPEWDVYQKNILFDITNSWYNTESSQKKHETNVDDHTFNELQYIEDKSYVELNPWNCQGTWQPILYKKAIDSLRNEIELLQGKQLISDSVVSMYPNIENKSYDKDEQQLKIKNGFSKFIPICTSKENTSYDYSVKINSNDVGFDVYFVSSKIQQNNFHDLKNNFEFYSTDSCYAKNKKSFSGTCNNIGKNSGLLIIIPNELDRPLTNISVGLKEKES